MPIFGCIPMAMMFCGDGTDDYGDGDYQHQKYGENDDDDDDICRWDGMG